MTHKPARKRKPRSTLPPAIVRRCLITRDESGADRIELPGHPLGALLECQDWIQGNPRKYERWAAKVRVYADVRRCTCSDCSGTWGSA
jgi:hypothetical protein